MKKIILFRVDGGKVWGVSMGHINRCLLVAKGLPSDCQPIFVMKDYADGVKFVKAKKVPVVTISTDDNSDDSIIELCEKYKPWKIIVDLLVDPYKFLYKYARNNKIGTIVFDVLGKCSSSPDILVNDSLVSKFMAYARLSLKTKKYLGLDYFVMAKKSIVMPIRDKVREIMITMGGSDPAGLTLKVIQVLRNTKPLGCKFNIILGPSYSDDKVVHGLVGNDKNFKIVKNPHDFLKLLSKQDIVITSAGRTLYECAYLGRPAVIAPSIEHESKVAKEYSTRTGSLNIGRWDDAVSPNRVVSALVTYIGDNRMRKSISKLSRTLLDGRGRERVIAIINHN
ncbi:hypothetical protein EPN54_05315 [bacterium]|nr:MAG: hypothetical protein EPN54_05315 [bacterium]